LSLAILVSALILCWPAFFNGYPLVFADSGNYIGQAMLHFIGWNAPPFYSLFLLATHWGVTLWSSILVQGLIVASLLAITLAQFRLRGPYPVVAASLGLAIVSALPWVTSQLLADVFTGVVVLSLALLTFGKLPRWQRFYLMLLGVFAVAVHQSHILLAFGLLAVGCTLRLWLDGRGAAWRAFRRLAPVPVLAAALVFTVNFFALGVPSLSLAGNVVLAARMIGDGTALSYLRAACPMEQYRICDHLDEVPPGGTSMLWQKPQLWDALGGHRNWAPEASRIIRGTVSQDPRGVAAAAISNGLQQFGSMETTETLTAWLNAEGPRPMIARLFPGDLAAFDRSRQQTNQLPQLLAPLEDLHIAVAWLGLAGLLAALWASREEKRIFGFCLMVLLAIFGNALVTGALSGVEGRYAARIAWLMPFVPCLVLARRLIPAAQTADSSM
jgi:hypothetical protein